MESRETETLAIWIRPNGTWVLQSPSLPLDQRGESHYVPSYWDVQSISAYATQAVFPLGS